MEQINFYEILGINKTATQEEIKAAYRTMSKALHPDAGGNAALFRLVNDAYETLSNPDKRRNYDSASGSSSNSASSETHEDIQFVRFEDAYREWRLNKMKTACPPIESWNAGGVRRLIRSSALTAWTDDPKNPDVPGTSKGDAWCGLCGFVASRIRLISLSPFIIQRERYGSLVGKPITNGDPFGDCDKCKGQLSNTKIIVHKYPGALDEPIEIKQGDFILLARNYLSASLTILGQRAIAFGPVAQGSAMSEFSLRNIKIQDEYSGKLVSPTKLIAMPVLWQSVLGHWKSNDLAQINLNSYRNWGK